jgi:hypothetical protein
MISAVLIALLATQLVSAAPGDVSLTKATVAWPQTQLGDDALQPQYDELWRAYDEKVAEATKAVEDELTRLYEAAKSDGNLDLALFWNGLKKTLAETGQLRWDPTSQKKDWKRFGEADFPDGLASILSRSADRYEKARDELGRGYKALEVALTKADKLEQALAMRKEFDSLRGEAANPPTADVPKPSAKAEVEDLLKQIKLDEFQGWKKTGGILISGVLGKDKFSPLSVPVTVRGDYDLVAEVNLRNMHSESRTLGMHMGLPGIEGSPKVAAYTAKADQGSCYYSATSVEGEKPPPTILPFTPGFAPNTWQEVLVRVRKRAGEVTVVINGKEIIKAAPFSGFAESQNATLGLSTGFNQMLVRRWELRKIP